MTIKELLSSTNTRLNQNGRQRHVSGTTSGAGAANGTTFISSGLGGVDDAWNEMEIHITSGDNSGQRRIVGDWVDSSDTGTLETPFTHLVANSVTFEIGEKGVISNHSLIELFTEAQDFLGTALVADAFPGHLVLLEVTATGGVSNTLPINLALPPKSLGFRSGVDEYPVVVIPPGERDRFKDDAFLGSTLDDMVAIFEAAVIKYRPVNNGTLLLPIVQKFADVTFSAGSSLPAYLHHLLVTYAAWKGWEIKENAAIAAKHEAALGRAVDGINAMSANAIKQLTTEN